MHSPDPDRPGSNDEQGTPKNVLILDQAVAFGGSIVSTANLVRCLDKARFRAFLGTGATEHLVRSKLREAANECPVLVLKKKYDYTTIVSINGRLSRLRSPLVRKALMYSLYLVRLFVNLPYMYRVAKAVFHYRIDLVQLNNGFGNHEGALVAILMRRPIVMFFRGYGLGMGFVNRIVVLPRVRSFVAVSDYVKAEAEKDGVPGNKITTATPPAIPEAVGQDAGAGVRARYGIPLDAPVVGMFGRIVRWKGQMELMRAAVRVVESVPDAHFLVVGDSADGSEEYSEELHRYLAQTHLQSQVRFTGYVDDVDAHYSAVDVVAHASIEPEPSGRVIFESMIHGIPIVASNLGGPKEFIEDGVDGRIVDPFDTEALAETLVLLLRNPDMRTEMGTRAAEKIRSKYNEYAYARTVMGVYDASLEPQIRRQQ